MLLLRLIRFRLVGLFVVVLFLARAALAADNARCRQQQKRRRNQQQDAEAGKDGDHLRPVPDDGRTGVAQLVLARTLIIVAQQEVILKEYKI